MALIYEAKSTAWAAQPKICNTNNHPADITADEYKRRIALTYKNEWVKSFPDPEGFITISLSLSRCRMLAEAAYSGCITGHRPEMYEEELLALEVMISEAMRNHQNQNWFVRLNEASPKDGAFGCGPVRSAADVVTSLATSMRARKALLTMVEASRGDTLYLIPWRLDWNETLEFRVFVHDHKVTGFSQYIWHKSVGWTLETIRIVAPAILKYCNETIIPKMTLPDFVVDLIVVISDPVIKDAREIPVIDEKTEFHVELVEFNSFGAELASGSALFHWINDKPILYGTGDAVVVRYVKD